MLAVMAGLSSVDDASSAPLGARIEERARAAHRGAPRSIPADQPTFLERMKAVIAA